MTWHTVASCPVSPSPAGKSQQTSRKGRGSSDPRPFRCPRACGARCEGDLSLKRGCCAIRSFVA
ncbi:hypothetical protein AKG07_11935 [Microbacterium sp. CGR1]|nr:hypothetical protein AKG07_11935 [Microbacterium sp. CGR1]